MTDVTWSYGVQRGVCGGDEKCSNYRYILMTEPMDFIDSLVAGIW